MYGSSTKKEGGPHTEAVLHAWVSRIHGKQERDGNRKREQELPTENT